MRNISVRMLWCILATTPLALGACGDEKPGPSPPSSSASGAISAVRPAGSGDAAPAVGAKGAKQQGIIGNPLMQLPGIDEAFRAAKAGGMLESWQKTAPHKARKFDGKKPAETAIEVGMALIDIAVLVSDTQKPVAADTIDQAKAALKALNPPPDVQKKLDAFTEEAAKGGSDDQKRASINRLIAAALPDLEKDPKLASTAFLAALGAYLRTLGVTSAILAAGNAADQDKLDLLYRKQENAFFTDFLLNKVDASLKEEPAVAQALEALKKVKDLVEKKSPSVEDAKAIKAALAAYAS